MGLFGRRTAGPSLPPGAVEEARRIPGGWVHQIEGPYGPDDAVPPQAIVGAWKVDDQGRLTGEFVPNPNHRAVAE